MYYGYFLIFLTLISIIITELYIRKVIELNLLEEKKIREGKKAFIAILNMLFNLGILFFLSIVLKDYSDQSISFTAFIPLLNSCVYIILNKTRKNGFDIDDKINS